MKGTSKNRKNPAVRREGPQTTIHGDVHGQVLSGNFNGPVSVGGNPGWNPSASQPLADSPAVKRAVTNRTPKSGDAHWCNVAIDEAQECTSEPGRTNPKVGCVVVREGRMLAKGYRGELKPGEHAEYIVIDRKFEGVPVDGATVYTTLEPCTHRSPDKTPCAERLAQARVARVVIGMVDPDPRITGRGIHILRDAGIQVDLFPASQVPRVESQNREFVRLQKRGKGGQVENRTTQTVQSSGSAIPPPPSPLAHIDRNNLRAALKNLGVDEIREIGAVLDAGLAAGMSKPAAIAHLLEWATTTERQQALRSAIGGSA